MGNKAGMPLRRPGEKDPLTGFVQKEPKERATREEQPGSNKSNTTSGGAAPDRERERRRERRRRKKMAAASNAPGKEGGKQPTLDTSLDTVESKAPEHPPTGAEKGAPVPTQNRRKRYKAPSGGAKPKDESTEFEKVKGKSRPARSKKSTADGAKNLERMLKTGPDKGEMSPTLRSFEEGDDDAMLKLGSSSSGGSTVEQSSDMSDPSNNNDSIDEARRGPIATTPPNAYAKGASSTEKVKEEAATTEAGGGKVVVPEAAPASVAPPEAAEKPKEGS